MKQLIKYYADWCVPCKRIAPIISKLCQELNIELLEKNIDIPENRAEYEDLKLKSIPALVLIRPEGEASIRISRAGDVGTATEANLREWLSCI